MRLITWNVNSIRARLPRVIELLEEHRPDVVCVQETKVAAAAFPHEALASVGYVAHQCSQGRWNGVALLVPSGTPVRDVVTALDSAPNHEEARWIDADVDGVRVASVYVPNGREPGHPMFLEKLAFLEAVHERLEALLPAGPVIVAGDLNVAREDRDVWDPAHFVGATHVTPDERERLAAILALGLRDAYRCLEPEAPGFTWWDYRMGSFRRDHGLRIDLALASEQVVLRSCRVDTAYRRVNRDGDKPSDHAPLLLELEV